METPNSNVVRVIVVVAIILIGGGALAYSILGKKVAAPSVSSAQNTQTTSTSAPSVTPGVATGTSSASAATGSTYKDGTYTATGSYLSPGGDEKIGVQLTLKDDIVTAASVTPEPVSQEGQRYQSIFQENFLPLVIGKNISSIHLTEVSGSSLTPQGFDDALAQIEAKAEA